MASRFIGFCLYLSLLAASADAAPLKVVDVGCDRLRDTIVAQLVAFSSASDAPAMLLETKGNGEIPDPPDYCMDTTAATTAAFSAAMHEAGIPVTWGLKSSGSGDYCLSHYLEQCYPRQELGGSATASQLSFVHDAWRAVRKSVNAVMPYGEASDIAVFETRALAGSMQRRLRSASPDARSDKPKSRGDRR
jgi:hypothetical protein